MSNHALTSLKSKTLVDFLAEPPGARTSVIVEAKRPPIASSLIARAKNLGITTMAMANRGKPLNASSNLHQMSAVEHELSCMGLETTRRLEAAGAFVVEVSPEQLRQLAESECVQAIHPNRFHRRREWG